MRKIDNRCSQRTKRKMVFLLVGWLLLAAATGAGAGDLAQGRATYLQYCVTCHGLTGEGDGPMARALNTPPANLRRLSERFGNPLPEDQVARYIDGRADVKAHGQRDMPIWGERLSPETQGNERHINSIIANLVAYLQSIQTGSRTASRD